MKLNKIQIGKLITAAIALLTSLGSGIGIGSNLPTEENNVCPKRSQA